MFDEFWKEENRTPKGESETSVTTAEVSSEAAPPAGRVRSARCESSGDCHFREEMTVSSAKQNVEQRGSSQMLVSEKDQFFTRIGQRIPDRAGRSRLQGGTATPHTGWRSL